MANNYVSVSGVTDVKQLEGISRIHKQEGLNFPLVIGYQVSSKSIRGGSQNSRQPMFAQLDILDKETRKEGFITAIHYYTKDLKTTLDDLSTIRNIVLASEALLQFNTLPPSLEVLAKAREWGFKTIFKVPVSDTSTSEGGFAVWKGKETQDFSTGQVDPLIKEVHERRSLIDYMMFDPSHGTNLGLNLNENSLAVKLGRAIIGSPELNNLGLVYAGGINPSNVRLLVRTLFSLFPNRISIDTESGVRTAGDTLDLELVRKYLVGYRDELEAIASSPN